MKPITATLDLGDRGPAVADLQDALSALLERAAILPADPHVRRELLALLHDPPVRGVYGESVRKIVSMFQKERGLDPSGVVDERTARALNATLRELGLLTEAAAEGRHVISGAVRRESGLPVSGVLVRAFHEADNASIRQGEDSTDADGHYTIRYEPLRGGQSAKLRLSAIGDDGRPLRASETRAGAGAVEIVDLTIPARPPAAARRLSGQVVLPDGRPAANVVLRIFRSEFGGRSTRLAETTTVENGGYAFTLNAASDSPTSTAAAPRTSSISAATACASISINPATVGARLRPCASSRKPTA